MPLELQSTFEQLLGRQASAQEMQRLYRVKTTLNVGDNDALWLVLMALESYDTLYRRYPAMISAEVEKIVATQRGLIAAMAEAETQRALGGLAQAVSATSMSIAKATTDTARWVTMAWACLGLLAFGCLCMFVGTVMASGRPPYWVVVAPHQGFWVTVLSALARTPAGWMAAIGGATVSALTCWRLKHELLSGQHWPLALATAALMALSVACLVPNL
jgi:hypothetical protein